MISAIELGNFKAFADAQDIPIRPLTLIFGPNSAGKSSLIHSLLLAHHAMETGELDTHRTSMGGESVDLGGFRQYIHRRNASHQLEWGITLDTTDLTGRLAELLAPVHEVSVALTIGVARDDYGQPLHDVAPFVTSYEISADGSTLLRMSRRRDGTLRLDRLEHEHQIFRQVIKAIVEPSTRPKMATATDDKDIDEAIYDLVPRLSVTIDRFLPHALTGLDRLSLAEEQAMRLFPVNQGNQTEDLVAAVRFFLPRALNDLIGGVTNAITAQLNKLRYLGPLRSYPPRHLTFSPQYDSNWLAGGGYAWDVLRRDVDVRDAVNAWLSAPNRLQTPYELVVRELVSIDELDTPLLEGLEALANDGLDVDYEPEVADYERDESYGGEIILYIRDPDAEVDRLKEIIHEADIDTLKELILIDRRSHTVVSHRDIGIGVSQVLPILVSTLGSENSLIAIEQPEIHLHPALQAEIGDLFIESALGERQNTFILETHSEHLILRIMRRMRNTDNDELPEGLPPVTPDDVAILYVQPHGSSSIVREIELSEDGQLLDPWPGGFFEEGFRERFD